MVLMQEKVQQVVAVMLVGGSPPALFLYDQENIVATRSLKSNWKIKMYFI